MTASGNFATNGVGGKVYYFWLRNDGGLWTTVPETPITIAPGDTSSHSVLTDQWTPQHSGSEQLVFVSPSYTVPAQSWSCRG